MSTQNIQLKGLTCSACVKLAQKRLQHLPQVSFVEVNITGQTKIVAERDIPPDEIRQTLAGTPYQLA